jgi:hypothetical protein
MPTTVQEERLVKRFNHWDEDNNGTLEKRDFEAEAKAIVEGFGETTGSPRGGAVVHAFDAMWGQLAEWAGVGSDGSLTLEQFVQVVDEHMLKEGNAGFARLLRPCIQAIVGLVDTDGDGLVNPDEFKVWLAAIGVDESTATTAFGDIDANGDGQLSVDELVNAVRDFHAGTLDVSLLG